ncbi:MAG TPA: peptidylprolyl isomerase [Euzebyales bacterium]
MRLLRHLRPPRSAALLLALTLVLAACSGSASTSDVAARVGDVEITTAEVDESYARRTAGASEAPDASSNDDEQKAGVLTTLIRSEILRQAAAERDIEITDEDIAAQRELVIDQVGGEEAFNEAIEQVNLSEEELEAELRVQAIQNEIVAQLADEVDESAVRDAFENDPQGRFGEKVAVRHILTEERAEARDAIDRIESGEEFAEVAADVSIDQGSAQSGGDLGEVARGQTVPPFEQAAFNATEDELVGPVKSEFGFHVLEVTDSIPAPDFADVEEQIRTELEAQTGGPAFSDFITGFISDLGIEVDERYGRWDEASVAVVPADQASESPALPSELPLPSEAPQPSEIPS